MTPDAGLSNLTATVGQFLAPALGAAVAIGLYMLARRQIGNVVELVQFRRRGFELYQTVRLNGRRAVITEMSSKQVGFLLANGEDEYEFQTVPCSRLSWTDIRRIVPKGPRDHPKET